MDPNWIHATIAFVPKPGSIDQVVAVANSYAKTVEASDPGVVMFAIARSKLIENPDAPEKIVVRITFKDKAAQEAYAASAHRAKFMEEAKGLDLLAAPPEVSALTIVGGFPPRK